ncbi:MAG: hypothetical protein R3C12_01240 [Planctomycetaceae bacterium]
MASVTPRSSPSHGKLLAGKRYGSPARQPIQAQRASLIYGVRSRLRADLSDWQTLPGLDVQICTEDGSEGHRGLVTELLEPMLRAGSAQKNRAHLRASSDDARCCGIMPPARRGLLGFLETPMACGYGACFSCVVPVRDAAAESGWDYRRSCVEGPVFRGDQIVWERLLAPTA